MIFTEGKTRRSPSLVWQGPMPWEIAALQGFYERTERRRASYPRWINVHDTRYDGLGLPPLSGTPEMRKW